MPQKVVHEDQSEHSLDDGCRADSDAGVVAAMSDHLYGVAVDIHAAPSETQARCGLQRDAGNNILTGADTTQGATGIVAER